MTTRRGFGSAVMLLLALAPLLVGEGRRQAAGAGTARAEQLFAERVRPLLRQKCLACHGGDQRIRAGLDLRTRAGMLRGGDSGPALVPGDAAGSLLYKAVLRTGDVVMPPKESEKLTAEEAATLKEWIDRGAPWAEEKAVAKTPDWGYAGKDGVAVATSGGLTAEWTGRKYKTEDLWAYRPVQRYTVPAEGLDRGTIANPIDAFTQHKLRAKGFAPAPPADRRTLLRRLTFGLTGLPPPPAEVDAFLKDESPGAYEKVVKRLLDSKQYGEQMARHWLDVTRYADSSGFANDYERGSAWRYRDYVVRSFNADKPYDRFVREQIAGDEIDPTDPELLVAVGFLRMGAWELTGMEVPKVARQRFLDDVTDAVGQVFLGHMLQCARCHDHKFDPVPTRDYYRLQACFATTQVTERPAAFLPAENTAGFGERKYLEARKARLDAELKRIQAAEAEGKRKWLAANPDKKGQKPPRHEFLPPADLGLERIARKGLERLRWEFDRYEPVALSVYSGRTPQLRSIMSPFRPPADRSVGELEASAILAGGDPFSPKQPVKPGVLSAVPELPIPESVEGRRKALTEWVVSPANPLTARVMANRIWQWHFGRGIVATPNNFGATGKKPTHPELLDWLASELVEQGWSVKHLHRRILLSETYRRSSRHPDPKAVAEKDPTGTGYAAFPPRRLTAEEIRDAMLAVSGELNRTIGGIPVRPELNPDVALQPRQVMGTFAPAWEPSPLPEQRHRRSLYVLRLRGLRDPFFEVFNQPGPDNPCEARETSTVTPQVFALFNGEGSRGRALALAARLLKETKTADEAITRAFRLALGRLPTDAERDACRTHWERMTERHRGLTFEKPTRPREVVREAVEENTGEKFRFTEVLEAAGDFVPDLHPADVSAEVRGLMEVCLVLFNANEFVYVD